MSGQSTHVEGLNDFALFVDAHDLHLVEGGVMRRVDFVSPVHVSEHDVRVVLGNVLDLVGGRVGSQEEVFGDVVSVAFTP